MARTIDKILTQELQTKEAIEQLNGLNSTSKVSIWRLLLYIHSVCINLFEQTWSIFKKEILGSIEKPGIGTDRSYNQKVFEFQYGDDIEYHNGVIAYPIIDPSKRVITRCVVQSIGVANRTQIYVSTGTPPEVANDEVLKQLRFYLKQIQFAGQSIEVDSRPPLKVLIEAEFYLKQNAIISGQKEAVISALNDYIASVGANNGLFRTGISNNEIVDAMQSIPDVKGVRLKKVAVVASDGVDIVIYDLANGVDQLKIPAYGSHLIPEDTPGRTLSDTINLIS